MPISDRNESLYHSRYPHPQILLKRPTYQLNPDDSAITA